MLRHIGARARPRWTSPSDLDMPLKAVAMVPKKLRAVKQMVARVSRPLWRGHPARTLCSPDLALNGPLFPGAEGGFLAAGAGRSRHSGRDARATNVWPLSEGKAEAFNF